MKAVVNRNPHRLANRPNVFVQQLQEQFKFLPSIPNFQNALGFMTREQFDSRLISPQRHAIPSRSIATGKRCVAVVTVHTSRRLRQVILCAGDGGSSADEADVNFTLVTASTQRAWAI